MTLHLFLAFIVTASLNLIILSLLIICLRTSLVPQTLKKPFHLDSMTSSPELARVSKNLIDPDSFSSKGARLCCFVCPLISGCGLKI